MLRGFLGEWQVDRLHAFGGGEIRGGFQGVQPEPRIAAGVIRQKVQRRGLDAQAAGTAYTPRTRTYFVAADEQG
jgi:hypothetical protein